MRLFRANSTTIFTFQLLFVRVLHRKWVFTHFSFMSAYYFHSFCLKTVHSTDAEFSRYKWECGIVGIFTVIRQNILNSHIHFLRQKYSFVYYDTALSYFVHFLYNFKSISVFGVRFTFISHNKTLTKKASHMYVTQSTPFKLMKIRHIFMQKKKTTRTITINNHSTNK